MPQVIYDKVVEVKERVCLVRDDCQMSLETSVVTGSTGEKVLYNVSTVTYLYC